MLMSQVDRRHSRSRLVAGIALVLACSDHTLRKVSPDTSSRPARTTLHVGAESAEWAWQDSSCAIHRTPSHPDPGVLVREYAARNDSIGFFTGHDKRK